jgi:hypothetical protein
MEKRRMTSVMEGMGIGSLPGIDLLFFALVALVVVPAKISNQPQMITVFTNDADGHLPLLSD